MDSSVNPTIKTLLYVAILASQLLCGLATVTSASRMLFAFSRDGGIPGASKMLATVSPTHRTPVAAIWAAAVLTIWSMVYYLQKAVPEIKARVDS